MTNTPDTHTVQTKHNNPWKTGVIATGAALAILVTGGFVFAAFGPSEAPVQSDPVSAAVPTAPAPAPAPVTVAATQQTAPAPVPAAEQQPPRENCTAYLGGTARDNKRIMKDGALGALVGAGTGAAGGAIADGGSGAGKGAGIGAVVGAVAGAFHGVSAEDKRAEQAERAYQDCLARNG